MKWNYENNFGKRNKNPLEFVILYMHPQVWNTISDETTKVATKGTLRESIVILCKSHFLTSKTDFLISIFRFLISRTKIFDINKST